MSLLYLFLDKYYTQTSTTFHYLPLLIEVNVFALIMASLAILNRAELPPFNVLSVLAVAAYLLAVTILFEKEVACQWIAVIAFSIYHII